MSFWVFWVCPGGSGGVPPGGSGAPGWQIPGTGAFWAGSRRDPANFSPPFLALLGVWGVPPRGVWGPRLAESRDPGPPVPVRKAPANFLRKPAKNTHFWLLEVWGVPPSRVWGPRLAESRDPGPPAPVRRGARQCSRKVAVLGVGGTLRGSGAPAWRVREAKCLLGALTSRRAAGTGREDPQPDNNPFQLRFCCDTHILCRVRREAESEKAPTAGRLGGWAVEAPTEAPGRASRQNGEGG